MNWVERINVKMIEGNMKRRMNITGVVAAMFSLWLGAAVPLQAADMTRFDATAGSKMKLEGTSTVHDWQAISTIIRGFLEVGPNFPTEPGQEVKPGKVEARGEAAVNVASLRSVKKDESPYDDKMDDKMHDMLKQSAVPQIVFVIKELVLKEAPKDKAGAYVFDSKGDLAVAGVTNTISMPVNVVVQPDKKLKITGSVPLKMSQFKIDPATILFVKTADDVSVKFEWVLKKKAAASAAAK